MCIPGMKCLHMDTQVHARHTSSEVHVHVHTHPHTYTHMHTPERKNSLLNPNVTCVPARKPGIWFPGSHTPLSPTQMQTLGKLPERWDLQSAIGSWNEPHSSPCLTPPWSFPKAYRDTFQIPFLGSLPIKAELWLHDWMHVWHRED